WWNLLGSIIASIGPNELDFWLSDTYPVDSRSTNSVQHPASDAANLFLTEVGRLSSVGAFRMMSFTWKWLMTASTFVKLLSRDCIHWSIESSPIYPATKIPPRGLDQLRSDNEAKTKP